MSTHAMSTISNTEKDHVWQAYRDHQAVRVPVTLGANPRVVILNEQWNPEGYTFQQALVGEPTSQGNLGDTIKTGRRGSLTGSIEIRGKQAHVAYAKSSENPVFALANFIHNGCAHQWDSGHEHFPATQFCVTQVQTPSNASNVTPSFARCNLNFRYNPASSSDSLKAQVNELLDAENLPYNCSWNPASEPFYKKPGQF